VQIVHGLTFDNIRGDIFGGLTAAVVALPLAMAFGVASGAGPLAGLYGAIIIGFFAAVFGGTPSQISGPTGPMTVVMAVIIARYIDQPAMAFTVVVMGGMFQVLFGVLRLGRYINLVPFPVVSGFMTGIGCIIVVIQLAPFLGHSHPGSSVVASLLAFPGDLMAVNWQAALIGALTLAIVYLTPKGIARVLPTPLIALVVGTIVVFMVLPAVPVIGEIPTGFPEPRMPVFDWSALSDMVGSAIPWLACSAPSPAPAPPCAPWSTSAPAARRRYPGPSTPSCCWPWSSGWGPWRPIFPMPSSPVS
jgi:sulfate permease, SulP family